LPAHFARVLHLLRKQQITSFAQTLGAIPTIIVGFSFINLNIVPKLYMKSITYLLLFISTSSFGQKFVPDSSTWHTNYIWIGTGGPGQQYTSYNNLYSTVTGDTIVGLDTFQIVQTEKVLGEPNNSTTYLTSYIFKDSNIVSYGQDINNLEVLYDFNLSVGDSIIQNVGMGTSWGTDTVKVVFVDTVSINGMDRKRIIFEDFTYHSVQWNNQFTAPGMMWVEGIGDLTYGIDFSGYGYNFIANWSLICFTEGTTPIFGTCAPASLEEDIEIEFIVYPNPTSDFININLQQTLNAEFTLYSVNGNRISDWNLVPGINQIDLSLLSNGIYMGIIQSGNVKRPVRIIIE
jgi:hypothetical protein